MATNNIDSIQLSIYVAERIRELRLENKLSQKELGEMLGCKRHAISKIENGAPNLTLDHLWKICYALNTSINDFFNTPTFKQYFEKHLNHKGER